MKPPIKRTTIYLNSKLHHALRIKAIQFNLSISDIISDAVQMSLKEDALDLKAIDERRHEPTTSLESVIKDLKKNGLL